MSWGRTIGTGTLGHAIDKKLLSTKNPYVLTSGMVFFNIRTNRCVLNIRNHRFQHYMKGSDGTREDTQDTTIVQIEEVIRDIRALPFVTKLSRVDSHKDKTAGWGATLTCASCPDWRRPDVLVTARVHGTDWVPWPRLK
jgi:hypothetical protein